MGMSSPSLLQLLLAITTILVAQGWTVSNYRSFIKFSKSSIANAMSQTKNEGRDGERPQLFVLGVCGGIGSGKSQACKLLVSELGCVAHIDADAVAHVVYEPGSQALKEIAKEFGKDVLNESGEVDRKMLGGIVFSDPSAMSALEHIVWPHVKEVVKNRIAELRAGDVDKTSTPVIVLEAAMLLDAGWEDLLDGLWVVTTSRSTALNRLVSNRGLTEEEAKKRMDAQEKRRGVGNLEEEVSRGSVTACMQNDGTLEDLAVALRKGLLAPQNWKRVSVAATLKDTSLLSSFAGGDFS